MTIEIRPPAEDELRSAMDAAGVAHGSGGVEDEDWARFQLREEPGANVCVRLVVRDPPALNLRWSDGLWLRLVDVEAALRARSYKPGESLVLEVTDDLCPWNAGRYRVGDDAGRTDDTADLALDVADLACAYLGGHDFHRLARAGLVDERVDGAVEAATLLFRTNVLPHCPEVF